MEIWKDVKGYEGIYQVSDLGRVRSLDRIISDGRKLKGKILKNCNDTHGYLFVVLSKNGKIKTIRVHKLVAITFLNHEPCGLDLVVDHIDNNKLNNKVSNLQLITQRSNTSKDKSGICKSTGVSINAYGKFISHIYLDGKDYHLGTFKSEKEASDVYEEVLQDYKNGIINIRVCSREKSSSYKYVSLHKVSNKWKVQKTINGKTKSFGYYDSEEEAYKKTKELFNI